MSKKGLYFTKQKHSSQTRVQGEKELPNVLKQFLKAQERIRPRAEPKTGEEIAYRQRLMEKLKPPSVKMAEAEKRKEEEEAQKRKVEEKEARSKAKLATLQAIRREQPETLRKFLVEMERARKEGEAGPGEEGEEEEAPPAYELTKAEEEGPLTGEEASFEQKLKDATSSKSKFVSSLNNLLGRGKGQHTKGAIRALEKAIADGTLKQRLDYALSPKTPGRKPMAVDKGLARYLYALVKAKEEEEED